MWAPGTSIGVFLGLLLCLSWVPLAGCLTAYLVVFCPLLVFSSHLAGFLLRQHCSQMINNLENGSESADGLIPVEKENNREPRWKGNDHWKLFTHIWANFIPHLDHCSDREPPSWLLHLPIAPQFQGCGTISRWKLIRGRFCAPVSLLSPKAQVLILNLS